MQFGDHEEASLRHLADQWIRQREPDLLRRANAALVQAAYDASGGNQVRTADLLGVSRNSLRTQLGHLGAIPQRRRGEGGAQGCVRVRIGIQRFGTSALLRLGGELERRLATRQILVDWRDFATGPPLLDALHAGEVDIGSAGEVPPIFAQADGAPLVYVSCETAAPQSIALVVQADSPIRSMLDLRGRRVALSPRANVHLLLLRALEIHGFSMDDIEPVFAPTGTPSTPSAMRADAWMMWDPYLSDMQNQGGFRIVFDGTGIVANHRFYLARRHFAATMPEIVDTVVEEARRVSAEAGKAPAQAANRLSVPFGMAPAGIELAMRRLAHVPKRLDQQTLKDQQLIADQLHALGLLPRRIAVEDALWSR